MHIRTLTRLFTNAKRTNTTAHINLFVDFSFKNASIYILKGQSSKG